MRDNGRHAREGGAGGWGALHSQEHEVGTKFTGTILGEDAVAGRRAIIPQIEGLAYVTQYSKVVVDETDLFPEGYKVADIW